MQAGRGSEWCRDVSAADWIGPRMHPFNQDTGSIIPEGFESYCRICHPLEDFGRWSELARINDRIVHPEMQLHFISTPRGEPVRPPFGDGVARASWGSLPDEPMHALVDVLTAHTATPERCWFAVWEGWGGHEDGDVVERVQLPERGYLLRSGPIEVATESVLDLPFQQSPSLWWPDARAWIVATEVDYAWTYVGGTRAAIDAVLADERLEGLPAALTDLPFANCDVINAALDR